jgi:hypothetical protein
VRHRPRSADPLRQQLTDGDISDAIDFFIGFEAAIVTADGGDLSGHVFLVVNRDADSSYGPGVDYVIDITGYGGTLTTANFI